MPYSDYFALREGYHAVISKVAIEDPATRWRDTYPHKNFVDLLRKIANMLTRVDDKAKKPIWIHGVYGTGKSRVAWTTSELLSCPPDELIAYFDDYAELREQSELREKLLGLKKGDKIVVATRYGSGEINSLDAFIVAVYQSVSEALKKRGLNDQAKKSLLGGFLHWLDDDINKNILTEILKAEPYVYSALPRTGAEVREKLLAGGESDDLLRSLLRIARERKILTISFTMDTLVSWLEEVITLNNLTAIVFFWDEFSDFIAANRNIYGEFQKLAEASVKIPFYLILVTHAIETLFDKNDRGARVMLDRFQNPQLISLPDYTAFKLLGHALKVKAGMEAEWEEYRDDINNRLENARRQVAKMIPDLNRDDFKNILPFHPYAALILKNVAQFFDSNQRSMFEFIVADQPDMRAFQCFIRSYGPEDAEILSIDRLWDYFYVTGQGKMGIGRDALLLKTRSILDAYPLIAPKYDLPDKEKNNKRDSPEQRVLKTVIILQALRSNSPRTKFFEATEANLETAFVGIDELDAGKGLALLKKLTQANELFVDQGIYQIPIGSTVDQSLIKKYADELRVNTDTARLINNFDPWNILPSNAALASRLNIRKLTLKDFKRDLNKLIYEEGKSWKIKVAMLFARDPSEATLLREALDSALKEKTASNILFIDAAAETLPAKKWEDYIEATARQRFFTKTDTAQATRENDIAANILKEWEAQIARGKFVLHSARFSEPKYSPDADDLLERLKSEVLAKYPGCCDFLAGVKEPQFKPITGAKFVLAGIMGNTLSAFTDASVKQLLADVRGEKYWESLSEHPLSRLKSGLEKKTRRAFAAGGSGRVAIGEILDDFMEQGFMSNSLSAYLTGYLFKEYATPEYRYSDGETGDVMSPQKLAEIIDAGFKKYGKEDKYREHYIEVLTREQRAFAAFAGKFLGLEGNPGLEALAHRFIEVVNNWGYPLWTLTYAPAGAGLEEVIDLLGQFLNPQNYGQSGYGDSAAKIGALFLKRPETKNELERVLTQDNLTAGVRNWLYDFEDGEIPALAEEIGAEDYLRDTRECLAPDGVWLWSKETYENTIKNLAIDYRFVAESARKGFLPRVSSKDAALNGWRDKINGLHLPNAVLQARYPEKKQILKIFQDISEYKILNARQFKEFYEIIKNNAPALAEIFANAYNVFKTAYAEILGDLPEKEVSSLYARLSSTSFRDDKEIFENELKTRAREIRDNLKRSRLLGLWKNKTGADTPAALSRRLRTPLQAILIELCGENSYSEAIRACKVIDNSGAADKEIEEALHFFETDRNLLNKVNDANLAESAFVKHVLNKGARVIPDTDKARELLAKRLGEDYHVWMDNPRWQNIVMELAGEEYARSGKDVVNKKIASMSPEKAKNVLLKLCENNFEAGMRVLEE